MVIIINRRKGIKTTKENPASLINAKDLERNVKEEVSKELYSKDKESKKKS